MKFTYNSSFGSDNYTFVVDMTLTKDDVDISLPKIEIMFNYYKKERNMNLVDFDFREDDSVWYDNFHHVDSYEVDIPNPDFEGEYTYNFGKYTFTVDKEHVMIDHHDGMSISFNITDELIEDFRKFLRFLQKEFNDTLNKYAYITIKEWIDKGIYDEESRNKYFKAFYESPLCNQKYKDVYENPFYIGQKAKKRPGRKLKSSRKCIVSQ